MGWDTSEYLEEGHPLQLAYRVSIESAAGANAVLAPDGCGMLAFGFELRHAARAFATLGAADSGPLARCRAAMTAHPDLVHGPGEIDTELMRADPTVVAKYGAEAIIGIGSTGGFGVVGRVLDGAQRALGPLGVEAARMIGATVSGSAIDRLAAPEVLDNRGQVVGTIRFVE
jgi:L-asparaginase II